MADDVIMADEFLMDDVEALIIITIVAVKNRMQSTTAANLAMEIDLSKLGVVCTDLKLHKSTFYFITPV